MSAQPLRNPSAAEPAPDSAERKLRVVDLSPPEERALTSRDRHAKLEQMMGAPEGFAQIFADAVRALVRREYERHVMPLIRRYWNESLAGPEGKKLRFLACNLYASAPYTVLFCSPRRPWLLSAAVAVSRVLALSPWGLARASKIAMALFGRLALKKEHRRIVLISAFIATIDHAFDHCMEDDDPVTRGEKIRGLIDGTWEPDTGPLKLVKALKDAMAEDISPEDRAVFEAALRRVVEWSESEVKGMTGIPDPLGLCHRLAGVEGTIDGLIFPVHRYAGEGARQWMYSVSLFVQMMDDWIDYEKDRRDIRETPVLNGTWAYADVEMNWDETVRGIEALAAASGLRNDSYQRFVRESYVFMMREVMEAMAKGVAA